MLTITKISKNKSLLLQHTSDSTEPSVSCAEASQSVLDFWYYDTVKQTLNLVTEHVEEEELKVRQQNSITPTAHTCLGQQLHSRWLCQ